MGRDVRWITRRACFAFTFRFIEAAAVTTALEDVLLIFGGEIVELHEFSWWRTYGSTHQTTNSGNIHNVAGDHCWGGESSKWALNWLRAGETFRSQRWSEISF